MKDQKNGSKPFCGQNLIPTFLVKKHKEHLTEKMCLREAANAKEYLELKYLYIEDTRSLPSKASQMGISVVTLTVSGQM